MSRSSFTLLTLACLLALLTPFTVWAGETNHYVCGVEGIKAGTCPPPGFYYRMYNVFYNAGEFKDEDRDTAPLDFDLSLYAMVNRFIWITDQKILGADYGMDLVFPLIYTDVTIGAVGVGDEEFGCGDITFEPLVLGWHGDQWDLTGAAGLIAPTGEHDNINPAASGRDMWTALFTFGGTWYFDAEKTWAASALSRYEIHNEKEGSEVRPGNDFLVEWGLSKSFAPMCDIGVTGYCQWQLTDDHGSEVSYDADVHDQIYSVGPEISVFLPDIGTFVSLRTQWEFLAKDRPEGTLTALTFTKRF